MNIWYKHDSSESSHSYFMMALIRSFQIHWLDAQRWAPLSGAKVKSQHHFEIQIHAFLTCPLHYRCELYIGLTAARLLTGTRKWEDVSLHFISFQFAVKLISWFSYLFLKSLHDFSPICLTELLHHYDPFSGQQSHFFLVVTEPCLAPLTHQAGFI